MIRRQVNDKFWLITQEDHAQISGQLSEQIMERGPLLRPSSASAILGIGLHDCGWPIHDDQPTLNRQKLPLDVFETPPEVGLRVWEAGAQRAAAQDHYAGLLVSLHALALSVFVTGPSPLSGTKWNLSDPRIRFEVNRFQHGMIELQESLRRRLGMRTDIPLKHGLAEGSADPVEVRLISDFRLLQAMDQLSLCICCTEPPFERIGPGQPVQIERPEPGVVLLDPWPFAKERMEIEVPYRCLPIEGFSDERQFRAAFGAADLQCFTVTLQPRTI